MTISEQVKERLDVVEIVSGYVKLNKAGINYKGLCPFHKEKTPSFMVSQEKQIWHCFGCNEGGDIFKFLMKYENLEFSDVLKILAKRAGIELKAQDPKVINQINRLYQIGEKATDFFIQKLKENPRAQEYLKERGLEQKTIDGWQLGFASPNGGLFSFLRDKGFSAQEIVLSGLAIKSSRQENSYFDRFRGRIIFPIADNSGRPVGFTGRIFGREENPKEPKYLNSPETLVFNKRRILYGFSENKKYIREVDEAILVEGQMDFLLTWQLEKKNVVASSGTALSSDQLKTIHRLAKKLSIAYDMDEAGRLAAERVADLSKDFNFQTKILILPDQSKDLGEYLEKDPKRIKELDNLFLEVGRYYYQKSFSNLDLNDLTSKNEAVSFFLSKLAKMNSIEKSHWLSEVSQNLGIKEKFLEEELDRIDKEENRFSNQYKIEEKIEKDKELKIFRRPKIEMINEQILGIALKSEEVRKKLVEAKEFLSEENQELAETIISGDSFPVELTEKIGYLSLLVEYEFSGERDFEAEFDELLFQLKKEIFQENKIRKGLLIKEAEKRGDEELLKKHLKEYNELLTQGGEF